MIAETGDGDRWSDHSVTDHHAPVSVIAIADTRSKNVRRDDPAQRPAQRNDAKILEAVLPPDPSVGRVPGQRVNCYVLRP